MLSVSVALLSAQDQSRLSGTVADTTGAVIPGAAVKVKNERTGAERSVTTSDFFITNLAASPTPSHSFQSGLTMPSTKNHSEHRQAHAQHRMQPTTVTSEVTVSAGELAVVETSSASVGIT
jgi:hypothetical protein